LTSSSRLGPPKWVPDCHAGGCYYFDGSDDTIVGPNLELDFKLEVGAP
jgi:hypothetical protein